MSGHGHEEFEAGEMTGGSEGSLESSRSNFIRSMVEEDLRTGKYHGRVVTRFPPEPNGYLHIGHAKSIVLNFSLAQEYGGVCHLRFDDTNPASEDMEYVESIQRDVRWLGFDWKDKLFFASDYYERLYEFAVELVRKGLAYVDSLNEDEIREYRGTVAEPSKPSPYRERSVAENLDLLERMKQGEFEDGAHVLRAKIDLASPNMKMRDPLLYRIRKSPPHYRRGSDWCIYPMYDFAHCLSDAIEGITHSLCTLEFDNNREIYDWILNNVKLEIMPPPEQTEFARLKLNYCVMSKRKLLRLVKEGHVSGWDDPRMTTISGMRRRGYTPEAIRDFAERVGISKANSVVDFGMLEFSVRNDLNYRCPRVMCVLDPLKVVIEDYAEGKTEEWDAPLYPHEIPKEGSRTLPFSREIWIERSDFEEHPPKGFHRLSPGAEVRLRHSYIIRCTEVIKDDTGRIVELRCTHDPNTLGRAPEGRKVKGIIHWVSIPHAKLAEVRVYDRLFSHPDPDSIGDEFLANLNKDSLTVIKHAWVEPSIALDPVGSSYQFERLGYFVSDIVDSKSDTLVFNRIVTLRDSWNKQQELVGSMESLEKLPAPPAKKQEESESSDKDTARVAKKGKTEAREKIRASSPELAGFYTKFQQELGLSADDADVLTGDLALAQFFEAALQVHSQPRSVANWMVNELLRELKDSSITALPFDAAAFASLVSLVDRETISGKIAKQVFSDMMKTGEHPEAIVKRQGLQQITDTSVLESIVDKVLLDNPEPVARFKAGEQALQGFFVGQIMKATKGQASPQQVNTLLRQKLS